MKSVLERFSTAGVSPIAGPDWNSTSRGYLTTEEVEAKEWGLEMVSGEITTDQYYASETPPAQINRIEDNRAVDLNTFSAGTETYLNNSFSDDPPSVVAHRSCIEILRSGYGAWKLTYNPDKALNQDYNRVYDSGCVHC
ncbi:hypothetical protein [Halostagnicola sp. A56]|uniref:hypothetical protein n=1 Tax=Halostagnicola sp. A56 TaxID=1495067 RepID=UPI0012E16635|nr:hypothetical protein [Halostagnicola sp. A56]